MVTINSISNGLVIDHIKAGLGIKIFNYMRLDKAEYTVALIKNAPSKKLGRKDIIKLENVIDIDFAVLGFIDPNITIDIIKNEEISRKIKLTLPERVENVIRCHNPRCVTSIEPHVPHVFYLTNNETGEYSCKYCDDIYKPTEV